MLRYFTRKLFKSNILPAVIKYKLHRGEARALKYSPSAIPTFPAAELDNNSPAAEMKTFDSFASGAKASPSRQYFYSGAKFTEMFLVSPSPATRSRMRVTFRVGGNISLAN